MIRYFLLLFLSFSSLTSFAQLEKTIHQTFELNDAAGISLKLAGDYEIINWSGNQILTETNIKLYDASEGILKHFLKTGRYKILSDTSNTTTFALSSKDMQRKPIRTKYADCLEEVRIRVFVPEKFSREDGTIVANSAKKSNEDEDNIDTKEVLDTIYEE